MIFKTFDSKIRNASVTLRYKFSSICPITMEPDDYSFMVEYEPTGKCIEIMSFKEYLDGFKEIQAFAEDIYNKIFYDIVTLVEPKSLTINLEDKSDGMQIGIWGRL